MMDRNSFYSLFAITDILSGNNPATRVCQCGHRFVKLHDDGTGHHKAMPGPQDECLALLERGGG